MNDKICYGSSGKELIGDITYKQSSENRSFELYVGGELVREIRDRSADQVKVKTVRFTELLKSIE